MGLGAYLSTVSETEHYDAEKKREEKEVVEKPHEEAEEIYEILTAYGVSREAVAPFVEALKYNPDMWVKVCLVPHVAAPRERESARSVDGAIFANVNKTTVYDGL
jgi:hypothetical protein